MQQQSTNHLNQDINWIDQFDPFLLQDHGITLNNHINGQLYDQVMAIIKHVIHTFGINKRKFCIIAGNYGSLYKVLLNTKQLELQIFRLQYNFRSTILIQLHHIHFPHLKQLVLCQNKISNSQSLAFIDMPNLQTLNFCWNDLINLNSFNKISFPRLTSLWLHCNKLIQINKSDRMDICKMTQMTLDRNELNTFDIIFFKSNNNMNIFRYHSLNTSTINFNNQWKNYLKRAKPQILQL